MGTYERCFKHVRLGNVYGHAARNRDQIKLLRKSKKELKSPSDKGSVR